MPKFIQNSSGHRIAWFVSPHGFGHAARSAAIMAALLEIDDSIGFEIFTKVPSWFFQKPLSGYFDYHSLLTDIGLVQKDPLHEDLTETIQSLDSFLPFDPSRIADLCRFVNQLKCSLIVCDIAPVGIAAARHAGIPSILIENFTWDWIYEWYGLQMEPYMNYLQAIFRSADYHIQTEPVCCPCEADLTTLPVSRKSRVSGWKIREKLKIPTNKKMIMITMGGVLSDSQSFFRKHFLKKLAYQDNMYFVIPGVGQCPETIRNTVLLPHNSDFFHPDLINACDAVVGKAGYSTIAEVYHAGVPFGYISRPFFRESGVLTSFIEKQMSGLPIEEADFQDGKWVSHLEKLLSLPRLQRNEPNGSEQAAQFIYNLVSCPLQRAGKQLTTDN
ncbi:hypothetical protein QUF80_13820 [Desulfococcaceae bacterium HSG8]|nr:hypothetical protein [Desulfococcaceae bacterium HSG8]